MRRCHCLLLHIFEDDPACYKKMVFAWGLMSNRDENKSAEEYGALKRAYAKQVSEARKGRSSWIKGKHLSDMQKKQISDSLKGHDVSDESKEKNRQKHIGRKHTEQAKQKIAAAGIGRKVSPEYRKRLSEERKGAGNPMYGRIPWNKGLKKTAKK